MYCQHCGNRLDAPACEKCGWSVPPNPYQYPAQLKKSPQETHGSSLYGILGIVFAFMFPLAGLVLSALGLAQKNQYGRRLAVIGLLLNIVMLLLFIGAVILVVVWISPFTAMIPDHPEWFRPAG